MMSPQSSRLQAPAAPDEKEIFSFIASIVTRITGVQLGEKQRHMVESRLRKRVLEMDLGDLNAYYRYFQDNEQIETQALVSLLTTHHTYFFREALHFEFLEREGIQNLIPQIRARADKTLRVWSAACSRGQEVYSLAMVLDRTLKGMAPDLKFEIYGTDVDHDSVAIAQNGVFHRKDIKEVPVTYLADHWARGTGAISDFVKAKASLKKVVRFEPLNLTETATIAKLPVFDVIFCRNVFIYFTPEQIKTITEAMLKRLAPTGYLFVGISETLHGLNLAARSAGPSIYVPQAAASPAPRAVPAPEAPIRVLCVDDSPSILSLMKAIFTPTAGYDLVGTAVNGIDAAEKVRALKPDVMTLDIHMPEQDGIEYLRANFGSTHPAVVMVSSVNRDNADLALTALQIGASDYVEKPALNQLKDRMEEIRTKVRSAFRNRSRASTSTGATKVDHEFKSKMRIERPEEKLRLAFGQISDRKSFGAILRTLKDEDPPCVILFEQASNTLAQFGQLLESESRKKVESLENAGADLRPGKIYVGDFATRFSALRAKYSGKAVSILVIGEPTPGVCAAITDWRGNQILIEEFPAGRPHPLLKIATDQFPLTSFMAISQEYLSLHGKTSAGGVKP